jgi:hypothetical protein
MNQEAKKGICEARLIRPSSMKDQEERHLAAFERLTAGRDQTMPPSRGTFPTPQPGC